MSSPSTGDAHGLCYSPAHSARDTKGHQVSSSTKRTGLLAASLGCLPGSVRRPEKMGLACSSVTAPRPPAQPSAGTARGGASTLSRSAFLLSPSRDRRLWSQDIPHSPWQLSIAGAASASLLSPCVCFHPASSLPSFLRHVSRMS